MRKFFLLILVSVLFFKNASAQITFVGQVVEKGNAKPIARATVFIGNSSYGTSSNENGFFSFKNIPPGKFILVVSCIGYETFTKDFQAVSADQHIVIELKPKPSVLNEVVVTPAEKNGWVSWGDLFVEHFIGNITYARGCKIVNPKALKFRRNEKQNLLTVSATEPLIIENKILGYTIRYELKEFIYHFTDNTVLYSGYALFEEMSATDNKTATKYKEARQKVYSISLLHFIRSLYANNLETEGYKIFRKKGNIDVELKKDTIAQQEYSGIEKFDTIYEISNENSKIKIVANELSSTANKNYGSANSSINSLLFYNGSEVELKLSDTLKVVYTKSRAPYEYLKYIGNTESGNMIVSEISLINNSPITIMPDGSFTPNNLSMNGFWGWWEKIAIMLPYDYDSTK
ncbi:MAG: carboxypeptidase-like regulatory domain-containing protein [Chitinophagaceae bacterium]